MHDRCRIRLGLGRPGGLGAVDAVPACGSRSAEASFVTCFGVRRSKVER